jgi:hypothetical protein
LLLRRLLVQAAHCILRDGAPDSDLKLWGLTKVQAGAWEEGQQEAEEEGGGGGGAEAGGDCCISCG